MNTIDVLLNFLRGPALLFSLMVCLLGLGRLLFLHLILILSAIYNARKAEMSYGAAVVSIVKGIGAVELRRAMGYFSVFKKALFFMAFFILPVFLPDHIVLVENILGTTYLGISGIVAHCISLPALVYLLIMLFRSFRDKKGVKSHSLIILVMAVFTTGLSASITNHFMTLKLLQILHGLTGNLLLIAVPFSSLANYFLFPLVKITTALGTWSLPAVPTRNETLEYFKKLKAEK